ncbi:secreted RxLR effector protein 161-like [Vicia villosa]|uniref:secreted RxLR effector protein 161-like n=1 Tax=Vicia villosa TaxID=3911 RepID=UPI00273BA72A|nr:secreted RxLR effector protein 161-like [Vicia villosa]
MACEMMMSFDLTNCKTAITPSETNHKLDYDVEVMMLDICYAVGMVSKFMNKLKWSRYQAVVKILGYIRGTQRYGVLIPSGVKSDLELICYSDSDWCGDRVDRRSTSEYFFKYLRSHISWCSKKQPVIALSTCKAEYIAGALSAC